MLDSRVLNDTDAITLSRHRMPLLGNAPGPVPAADWIARARVGLTWWAFCWCYDYCRPLHDAWFRRMLGRK